MHQRELAGQDKAKHNQEQGCGSNRDDLCFRPTSTKEVALDRLRAPATGMDWRWRRRWRRRAVADLLTKVARSWAILLCYAGGTIARCFFDRLASCPHTLPSSMLFEVSLHKFVLWPPIVASGLLTKVARSWAVLLCLPERTIAHCFFDRLASCPVTCPTAASRSVNVAAQFFVLRAPIAASGLLQAGDCIACPLVGLCALPDNRRILEVGTIQALDGRLHARQLIALQLDTCSSCDGHEEKKGKERQDVNLCHDDEGAKGQQE